MIPCMISDFSIFSSLSVKKIRFLNKISNNCFLSCSGFFSRLLFFLLCFSSAVSELPHYEQLLHPPAPCFLELPFLSKSMSESDDDKSPSSSASAVALLSAPASLDCLLKMPPTYRIDCISWLFSMCAWFLPLSS